MPFRYTVIMSSYCLQYLALYTLLFNCQLAITLGHATPMPDEITASEAQLLRDDPMHTMPLPVSPGTAHLGPSTCPSLVCMSPPRSEAAHDVSQWHSLKSMR